MVHKPPTDVMVLGAGPGALAIAASLCNEKLNVAVLSASSHKEPWPYTYGIWGKEVDELGLDHLLEHRWQNTVSFFGKGSNKSNEEENQATRHEYDYGLFDKSKLQSYWLSQCSEGSIEWHEGLATELEVTEAMTTVTTKSGIKFSARLLIDATGYEPVFLKVRKDSPIAVQTCYGIVGKFNKAPVAKNQFVLMDYRCDHLSNDEKDEPPTFLYAMDLGENRFFLEETSLGLSPPLKLEKLKARLEKRLKHRDIKILELEHEELGIFLPMNMPLPSMDEPFIGFGGSASMVHPASGYMVGALLRRAPCLAKALANAMKNEKASPASIAKIGWANLWPSDLRRKQALYQFGLEKLMRFTEEQLRDFFKSFFGLPKDKWYGFLTNTLSLKELIYAMWTMFLKAPWNVRLGLMGMEGRELKLLWNFLKPNA